MAGETAIPGLDLENILGQALGGLGGGSNAASSTSNNSVSVNPVISIVTGGGNPTNSTSGNASANPSSNATAQPRPISRSAYGYGGTLSPLHSAGDVIGETGGTDAQGNGGGFDLDDPLTLALIAGAGIAAYYALGS